MAVIGRNAISRYFTRSIYSPNYGRNILFEHVVYTCQMVCAHCRARRIDSNHRVLALTHRSKGMAASCINTENVMIALSEMS
jgi:hypothetical protein